MPRTAANSRPAPAVEHRPAKLQRILRHAAQVFAEKGYEGASMREISRSSGVPLAGLYYYCPSKQKLLYLIQIGAFTEILERLEQRLRGVHDPLERLRILVTNHLDYFLRHPVEMKVLTREEEALEAPYRREVAEIKRRYYARAREIFEALRRSGRVRRVNPRVAVLSLFGMMNWIYTWHNPRVDPGAERLAETMAGIFLEGVANGHPGGQRNGRARARPARSARGAVEAAGRLAG